DRDDRGVDDRLEGSQPLTEPLRLAADRDLRAVDVGGTAELAEALDDASHEPAEHQAQDQRSEEDESNREGDVHEPGDPGLFILFSHIATLRVHSQEDRKSTRLNSSHVSISYADFYLEK